ncbi:unnamed protein product [Lactuca virosa]|uniref:Uncharacterized protein n=1 Tax=Lactuca virosa TaxID=75947 RepID=A0AAU9P5U5_9ASTR|nr:unnamed protein product [Lactuca virosa]
MEIDEELAKQLKAKELKSKQEMLLKKKSSEISPEERSTGHDEQFRVSSPKRTIFSNPDRDSYQKVKVIKPTNSKNRIFLHPRMLGEKEAEEPNLDLNMENETARNMLKKPHKGVVFSSKGRLKFMRICQKHILSSEFIKGIIGLLKRTRDQDEPLRVKIIEELTWFLSFPQWLINLRNKG